MIRVFDFVCPDGHKTEGFVSELIEEIPCSECGEEAHRVLSAPNFRLDGISGDFPTASAHWEKVREERRKWEITHDRTRIE